MLSRSILGLVLAIAFAAPTLADDTHPIDPHSSAAIAADAHLAAAARLQRITVPRDMMLTLVNSVMGIVRTRAIAGVDPAKTAQFDAVLAEAMTPAIDGMDSILAARFASHFSDAQIREYTAFFSQPIYARHRGAMLSAMPKMTAWFLDHEQNDMSAALDRARTRASGDISSASPAPQVPDSPPPDAHTALILSVYQHAQSTRGPLEEVLWRTQARKLEGLDDPTKQKIHDAFIVEIAPQMPAYRLHMAQIFAADLSDEELKQLDDFVSAPAYGSFMTEFAVIMKETMPEFATWMKVNVLPNMVKSLQKIQSEGTSP